MRAKESIPVGQQWATRNRVHMVALVALTIAGLIVCYQLTRPFLPALAWSFALAIVATPAYAWIETKVRPNLAAAMTVLGVGVAVMLPMAFVAQRLVAEATKGAAAITLSLQSGAWRRVLEGHPRGTRLSVWFQQQFDLPGMISSVATWLTSMSPVFVQGSLMQLFGFVLTFYFLFYFLRDRRLATAFVRDMSPLSRGEMDRLCARVVDTVHATLYGTVAVAVVQGSLGGLMFWWLDLPAPLIWGVIMALLAIVPVLGAFVVWIPTACVLALDGRWGHAALLVVWGSVVVGSVDNVLYPALVGNRLKLHTVPALIAVIGGVSLLGASGLIVGPVVTAVTASLLDVWRARVSSWTLADDDVSGPSPANSFEQSPTFHVT